MQVIHQTHFVFLPFLWVEGPYFTRLRAGFGIWGAIALFFIRVHPCSSAFICGQKKGDRF